MESKSTTSRQKTVETPPLAATSQLQQSMQLQPVQAVSSIEFNEVFRIPLNKIFYNVYRSCYTHNAKLTTASMVTAKNYHQLIDMRPNRWYKAYKYLLKEIEDTQLKLDLNKRDLAEIKEELNKVSWRQRRQNPQIFDELNQDFENYSTENIQLELYLDDLRQYKLDLLQEMRNSGYYIKEMSEHTFDSALKEKLQRLGYNFAIYKTCPLEEETLTDPFADCRELFNKPFTESEEGNKNWEAVLNVLEKKLLKDEKTMLQTPEKRKEVETELEQGKMCVGLGNMMVDIYDKQIIDLIGTDCCGGLYAKCVKSLDILSSTFKEMYKELQIAAKWYPEWMPEEEKEKSRLCGYPSYTEKKWLAEFKKSCVEDKIFSRIINELEEKDKKNYFYPSQTEWKIREEEKMFEKHLREWLTKKIQDSIYNIICKTDEMYKEKIRMVPFVPEVRRALLQKWTTVENHSSGQAIDRLILPGVDPLAEAIEKHKEKTAISQEKESKVYANFHLHTFTLQPQGLFNQENQSLQDFMNMPNLANTILVLPYFDKNGVLVEEMRQLVAYPQKPKTAAEPRWPVVKFVETQVLKVNWNGTSIGELRHSINLAPEESKEVVVELQTKLAKTLSENQRVEKEEARHINSSFEDNLQQEFAAASNTLQASQKKGKLDYSRQLNRKNYQANSAETFDKNESHSSSSSSSSSSASAGGGMGFSSKIFSFGASMGGGSSSSSSSSSSNSSLNSRASKSMQGRSAENALAISMSCEGQQLSKNSRDISAKNVQNAVRKVGQETSQNNKLEVAASSTSQSENTSSHKEVIKLNNANTGRTINYNFYQVQNVYLTRVYLSDVKIVVNTGSELVEGTGITPIRVYELEEFNKIYQHPEDSDLSALLCARIAVQVLKQYTQLFSENANNNGALKLALDNRNQQQSELKNIYERLRFTLDEKKLASDEKSLDEKALKIKMTEIRNCLKKLSKFKFTFSEANGLISESKHCINAPAFHLDTQMGLKPATEEYLEERRKYELNRQQLKQEKTKAEIDYQRAVTKHVNGMTETKNFSPQFWGAPITVASRSNSENDSQGPQSSVGDNLRKKIMGK